MTVEQKEEVRTTYDDVAPDYDDLFAEVNRYGTRVEDFLTRYVQPGQRWLDVGCGPGNLTEKLDVTVDVVGVDLSPEMIRMAKERRPSGTYVLHDFHEPYPDELGIFDGAVAIGGFEFCTSPQLVLHHIAQVLKPGAHALFTFVERRATIPLQQDRFVLAATDHGQLRIHFWSFEEIAAAMGSAGFIPVKYEFGPGWVAGSFDNALLQYGWWTVERAPIVASL